jgi:hypothetical protein
VWVVGVVRFQEDVGRFVTRLSAAASDNCGLFYLLSEINVQQPIEGDLILHVVDNGKPEEFSDRL